jgi:predicted Zn-dependent protease
MITKLLLLLLLVFFLTALFYPRILEKLLRRFGRFTGDAGRVGQELATGIEVENSPLARYEERAGDVVARRVLADNPPTADEALQREIAEIGERLARHAQRKQVLYRFQAVESAAPNAFAVPGGSVFITLPLLGLCDGDPHRIACVLGHEVIHIDRRHAIRHLAAKLAARAGLRVFSLGRAAMIAKLAGGIEGLFEGGYRQDQEFEADLFGTRLAKLAGFDPRGLIALLERVRAEMPEPEGPIAEIFRYFATHPPARLRIEKLRAEWGAGEAAPRP